ncbi:hypothetical protein [Paraglaciecola sp.]|uniref:hypothetical protein n=1 Tax=Paraglaciecola sp. TaxID=1920173 RepID=UPI003263E690
MGDKFHEYHNKVKALESEFEKSQSASDYTPRFAPKFSDEIKKELYDKEYADDLAATIQTFYDDR